ncbi:hypothetical protein ACIQ34_00450 [Ureibacillus sp. NPDC094379]
MTKRLDEVELQLAEEKKRNKKLLSTNEQLLQQENEEVNRLHQQIRELEVQISTQFSTELPVDDEIIQLQAIHKSQMREKDEQIRQLQSELEMFKEGLDDKGLYMQMASLKQELKQKAHQIAMQEEQIQQLVKHIDLAKDRH